MKNIGGASTVVIDGDNLPSPVGIGLNDLSNIGGTSAPLASLLPASVRLWNFLAVGQNKLHIIFGWKSSYHAFKGCLCILCDSTKIFSWTFIEDSDKSCWTSDLGTFLRIILQNAIFFLLFILENSKKFPNWRNESISLKITCNRAARSLHVCQIATNNGRWQQWFDQSRRSSNRHQGYLGYSPVKTKVRLKNLLNDWI